MRIAREVGRPLVGTGDVHYLRREDYHHHTALLCVQTKSTLAAPKMTFDTNEFFLRSSEEMVEAFAEWPEAIASTLEIAERCDVDHRARPPAHPALPARGRGRAGLPARARDGGAARPLRRPDPRRGGRARRDGARGHRPHGLQRLLPDRLGLRQVGQGQRHRRRARAAAARPARSSPTRCASPTSIRCATTCSSSASSIPSACRCRISTSTSPCAAASASCSTWSRSTGASRSRRSSPSARCSRAPPRATPRACSATTTASATGWPSSSPIPSRAGRRASTDCLQPGEPLRGAYDTDADGQADHRRRPGPGGHRPQRVDPRRGGRHRRHAADRRRAAAARRLAAGNGNGNGEKDYRLVTQFSMKPVEELGLLKMDFLGLRNLDVIEDALDIIERSTGERPGHDEPAARRRQDLRDAGPRRLGRRVPVRVRGHAEAPCARSSRPSSTTSSRSVALYRPGAMDQIPTYARGKRNPERSRCPTSAWRRSSARRTA